MDPTQDPTAAPAAGDPTASGAAGAPGADPGESSETITITPDGQGGWTVDDGDGQPLPCKSIGDVIKAVHDALSGTDDNAADAKGAWAAEASKRDGSGMPAPGGAPSMTMP